MLLGALLAPAGCGVFSSGKGCHTGDGLKAAGYRGELLPAKTLVLVFDGGPNDASLGLGEVLAAHGVQATFFVEGIAVKAGATALQRLKDLGNLVGNRAYTSAPLDSVADPASAIRKTDALIAPYVSGDIFLLRAPGGVFNETLAKRLTAAGLGRYVGPIRADVGDSGGDTLASLCWSRGQSVEVCAQTYVDSIRSQDHGIVAFDGTNKQTADLLRVLLPKLKDEGYLFVRLDQVASIRQALEGAGAKPGTVGGASGCQEYER